MNYQHKLNHYREFYSFHEYQQVMRLIYSIDTYVNNILEMNLGDDTESALIFAFIDQNEIAIKEAIGRLTLFGQDVEDDDDEFDDEFFEPKERFEEEDDDRCGCCVKGVGAIDSNGRNIDPFNLPYTDDDNLDLRDDFADDEEESFADDEEEGYVDDEEDDERDLYLLRKLIRGIRAILKELEL